MNIHPEVTHLIDMLPLPAFLASNRAELLHGNAAFLQLLGLPDTPNGERTLIGLGIFSNQAEFRGFVRGFATVSPVQRLPLPTRRLRRPDRPVVLQATQLDDRGLLCGVLTSVEQVTGAVPPPGDDEPDLLNAIAEFVLVVDGNGRLLKANQAARTELRLPPDGELTAQTLADVDAEYTEVQWRQITKEARLRGRAEYVTHFLRRNGTLQPVRVTIGDVQGFPVRRAVLSATDISRQRAAERDLRATQLRLEDLQDQLERRQLFLRDPASQAAGLSAIVSQSDAYRPVLAQIRQVGPTDATVLITGETGTGKELVARAVHALSDRPSPMVVVNCGALPRELIESELFGYRKGAFTGADRDRPGRFELADGGTLFLDEIGELPLPLQTRLLRFLQEGEFSPVGGSEVLYANVRIIAATNRDLREMVDRGEFRSDLFFRLNVFPIHNPPLRERPEDIEPLVHHFINKHGRRLNRRVEGVEPATLARLRQYRFPGNVRELENIVERALITAQGDRLRVNWDIYPPGDGGLPRREADAAAREPRAAFSLRGTYVGMDELQRRYITSVLKHTDGKVSGAGGAAELLGMNPQTLFSRMRKLGINRK